MAAAGGHKGKNGKFITASKSRQANSISNYNPRDRYYK